MRELSPSRLLLSGLLAGMLIDSIQYLLDSFVFTANWDALAQLVSPAAGHPSAFPYMVTATRIEVCMQLVGFAAGLFAVRLSATNIREKTKSRTLGAAVAWMPTYGLICIAIVLISRTSAGLANPPIRLAVGIGFALSSLVACWAGCNLGTWVYRESGRPATERSVSATTGTKLPAAGAE